MTSYIAHKMALIVASGIPGAPALVEISNPPEMTKGVSIKQPPVTVTALTCLQTAKQCN